MPVNLRQANPIPWSHSLMNQRHLSSSTNEPLKMGKKKKGKRKTWLRYKSQTVGTKKKSAKNASNRRKRIRSWDSLVLDNSVSV